MPKKSDTKTNDDNAAFGDQVTPENQTREDAPHVLAKPARDKGPITMEEQEDGTVKGVPSKFNHPNNRDGTKTYSEVNEPVQVLQRTNTMPDWAGHGGHNVGIVGMAPDHFIHGGASDIYNPEKGEGLTDMVVKQTEEREDQLAPLSPTSQGGVSTGPDFPPA